MLIRLTGLTIRVISLFLETDQMTEIKVNRKLIGTLEDAHVRRNFAPTHKSLEFE